LTNVDTIKKDILGILKNLYAAHGDSTASPLPPLRRQPRETAFKDASTTLRIPFCNFLLSSENTAPYQRNVLKNSEINISTLTFT